MHGTGGGEWRDSTVTGRDSRMRRRKSVLVGFYWKWYVYTGTPLPRARPLQDGRVEAELAPGIVLFLEGREALLPPRVVAVPLLRRLGAVRVVDVRVQLGLAGALVDDVAQLGAEGGDGGVLCGARRVVDDERGGEHAVGAEGEGAGAVVDGAHAARGVVFEHEDGVCVGVGGARDGGGVDVVGEAQRSGVVVLDVDGEAGVVEAKVLARRRVEGDVGPRAEVAVGARLGRDGEGTQLLEGLSVDGVDDVDALLHGVHDDDGLQRRSVSTCSGLLCWGGEGRGTGCIVPCRRRGWHRSASTTTGGYRRSGSRSG
jgi:hypothetical protein